MPRLTHAEKRIFEELLQMSDGYVLDFTNARFQEFFQEEVGIDIYDEIYTGISGSKANRLRKFWSVATEAQVLKATAALFEYAKAMPDISIELLNKAEEIVLKLGGVPKDDCIKTLKLAHNAANHAHLIHDIEKSIQRGTPQAAMDRLHSLALGYLQYVCEKHGIMVVHPDGKKKPLDSLFGEYRKFAEGSGKIVRPEALGALKRISPIFKALGDIRNHQSLAHVNELTDAMTAYWFIRDSAEALRKIYDIEKLFEPSSSPITSGDDPPEENDMPF